MCSSPRISLRSECAARRAAGFTLIELIAVIVILAVLAVVAVPQALNLRADARDAAIDATATAFYAGVSNVRSYWMVKGTGAAQVDLILPNGRSFDVNDLGLPVGTSNAAPATTAPTSAHCLEIFRTVMGTEQSISASWDGANWIGFVSGVGGCVYYHQQWFTTAGGYMGFIYQPAYASGTWAPIPAVFLAHVSKNMPF